MLVIRVRHFQKKDPVVTGLFCVLLPKSYFDRKSHSPEGDQKTDFHRENVCWWGLIAQPLPTRVESRDILEGE